MTLVRDGKSLSLLICPFKDHQNTHKTIFIWTLRVLFIFPELDIIEGRGYVVVINIFWC